MDTVEPVEVLEMVTALASLVINALGLYQAVLSRLALRAYGGDETLWLANRMRLCNAVVFLVAGLVGVMAAYVSLRLPYPLSLRPDETALRPIYQWGWVLLHGLTAGAGLLGEVTRRRLMRLLANRGLS